VVPLLASGDDALRAWCDDACVRRNLRKMAVILRIG
jgi:hypothetical protein